MILHLLQGLLTGAGEALPPPPVEVPTNTPGFLRNLPQFAPPRRREKEELEIVERIAAGATVKESLTDAAPPNAALADLEAALTQLETQAARSLALQQIAMIQAQLAINQARERARQDDDAIALIAIALAIGR